MSNSYQRAKARVKELEEQLEYYKGQLANWQQANGWQIDGLIRANETIELQEHFAKLSEKDIKEKNEIIATNKKTITLAIFDFTPLAFLLYLYGSTFIFWQL